MTPSQNKAFILILMLSIGSLSGCLLKKKSDSVSTNGNDLSISFQVIDKFGQQTTQFVQGDQATLRIIYHNKSDKPLSLSYTAPGFTIDVRDINTSQTVWASNYGLSFAQVIGQFNMSPQETTTVDIEWNLTGDDGATTGLPASGNALPVGVYEAKFSGYYGGIRFDLNPLQINIQ